MLHREEREAYKEYGVSNKAKTSFIRQKVKQQWLKGGDANTAYFHACLRKRRDINHIYRIKIISGEWKDDPTNVDKAFLEFYEKLLGNTDEPTGTC